MRQTLLTGAAVGLALLLTGRAGAQIRWRPSFDEAQQEAGRANKLVMVDFYTDW